MTLENINMDYTVNNEAYTQQQVIGVLQTLGFTYLGNWQYREGNSNIEPKYLNEFLKSQGHLDSEISKVYDELNRILSNKQDGYTKSIKPSMANFVWVSVSKKVLKKMRKPFS